MHNEKGKHRVVVTKDLPGERWLNVLKAANCRVEVCQHDATILDNDTIVKLIGDDCMGVLGQLTEVRHILSAWHATNNLQGGAHMSIQPYSLLKADVLMI